MLPLLCQTTLILGSVWGHMCCEKLPRNLRVTFVQLHYRERTYFPMEREKGSLFEFPILEKLLFEIKKTIRDLVQ